MRILYTVPLLHSEVESLREMRSNFARLPKEDRISYLNFVNQYWKRVKAEISNCQVDRVFLDGYVGGPIYNLIKHAKKGSQVSETVKDLVLKKGAVLEPTEEAPLILEMHLNASKLISSKGLDTKDTEMSLVSTVITRDLFIRKNIRSALREGEKGIYFYGFGHFWLDYGDIKIVEVYPRQRLKEELVNSLICGRGIVNGVEINEMLLRKFTESGFLVFLEDYVEHPEKYGYNYTP